MAIKTLAKNKLGIFALLLALTFNSVSYSLGPSGETQWFSTGNYGPVCQSICFDPGDGSMVRVEYAQIICQSDWWGTCAPRPCGISCRELLRLGLY